jgi:hypothetical protein
MAKQGEWEYIFRRVTDNLVVNERSLAKTEGSGQPGPVEREVNKLADEGWELMPMVPQTSMGSFLLVFRRPKASEGVHMARL